MVPVWYPQVGAFLFVPLTPLLCPGISYVLSLVSYSCVPCIALCLDQFRTTLSKCAPSTSQALPKEAG